VRSIKLSPVVEARIWAAIIVGGAGAAAGEIYNALTPRGVFSPVVVVASGRGVSADAGTPAAKPRQKPTASAKAVPAKPRVIELAEAQSLADKHAARFVDARSALRFAAGHIPGAVSIPSTDFDAAFARLKARLPANAATVVYCEAADCDESDIVLDQLVKRGYTKLMHFKAGMQAWEDRGLPQEQGAGR
jgi:rhodanese-related sulfurtransferase